MLTVSDSAIQRLQEMKIDGQDQVSCLRLFIEGGGCQGLQYGIQIEPLKEKKQDHTYYAIAATKWVCVIDPISLPYIQKATLDFESTLQKSQFVLRNPGIKMQCPCKKSFCISQEALQQQDSSDFKE